LRKSGPKPLPLWQKQLKSGRLASQRTATEHPAFPAFRARLRGPAPLSNASL
jgi:hypothetical protein